MPLGEIRQSQSQEHLDNKNILCDCLKSKIVKPLQTRDRIVSPSFFSQITFSAFPMQRFLEACQAYMFLQMLTAVSLLLSNLGNLQSQSILFAF